MEREEIKNILTENECGILRGRNCVSDQNRKVTLLVDILFLEIICQYPSGLNSGVAVLPS